MNRQIKSIIVYLVAAIISLMFLADTCNAGEAAPYTKDAYVRIEKALKDHKPPRPSDSATPFEKQKAAIEMFREIFRLAGYDFDATIRKVAHDLKNNPDRVPRDRENVATMVVVLMSYIKSHCEYERVNCLDIFDYQTSESIKWLWGRDILKKEYGAKEPCPPETKDQAKQAIKATWAEMAEAMASGNLEKAFGFFSFFSRDEMKRKMSDMSKEQIKNIFSNYESIEINTLYENDGIAECGVIRKEKSGRFSYPVSFGRDPDCRWRIRGL